MAPMLASGRMFTARGGALRALTFCKSNGTTTSTLTFAWREYGSVRAVQGFGASRDARTGDLRLRFSGTSRYGCRLLPPVGAVSTTDADYGDANSLRARSCAAESSRRTWCGAPQRA